MTLTLQPDGPNGGNGTVAFGQGITYIHTRSGDDFSFPILLEKSEKDLGAFGPNFKYAINAGPLPAPKPSTMLLGVLASLVRFVWKQRWHVRL